MAALETDIACVPFPSLLLSSSLVPSVPLPVLNTRIYTPTHRERERGRERD
jgi:hypothetical protein